MKNIENQFWKYVIPSMITVLLGGTFAFVDGIFIGQGAGDVGLTAVNIVAPVAALVTALAAGIGMGGSIIMSTYAGNKDDLNVKKARGNTIFIMLIVAILVFVVGFLFSEHIVFILGARGNVVAPAFDYLKIVLTLGCFQILSSGLSNLIINSGKSVIAMVVMVGALILNIVLDAIFVLGFNMGTLGAAIATVVGQAVSAVIYVIILIWDKKTSPCFRDLKPNKAMIKKVIKTGFSPFGIQLAPSIVVMCINYACVWTKGTDTLATFAVVNQLILAIQILFTGIGNGIQPIISYCTGSNNKVAVEKTFKKAMAFMMCISLTLIIGIYAARFRIPELFNASKQVSSMVYSVIYYVLLIIPFTGFNRVIVPYFFASGKDNKANIITYIEPIIITPVCLVVFCAFFGSHGIWYAMVMAQVLISALSYVFLNRKYSNNIP